MVPKGEKWGWQRVTRELRLPARYYSTSGEHLASYKHIKEISAAVRTLAKLREMRATSI
jgi:hypothetical protein